MAKVLKHIMIAVAMMQSVAVVAQKYDGFILPLTQEHRPQLSSNFGELRVSRFHSGLDFRTDGAEGLEVRAVADGYIYRIGIKPYGYGKVLYLQHAGGVQTVYAHLRNFTPDIEEYVKAERYRLKANTVDLFLSQSRFPVKKGQLLGHSGNTGASSGPHLHFEVREGATDRTLNPITLGIYDIADDIAPTIVAVCYYVVDTVAGVPFHTLAGRYPATKSAAGVFRLAGNVKVPGAGYYAVEAYDRKNDTGFNMAVYRITEKIDGQVRFEFLMDGFTFPQTVYARTVGVYAENRASNGDTYRLAVQDDVCRLPFYRNVRDMGLVYPWDGSVEIEVADDSGNVSVVRFDMEYDSTAYRETVIVPTEAEILDAGRNFTLNSDGVSVSIPAGTLYESIFYTWHKLDEAPAIVKSQSGSVLSPFYAVHNEDVPLHSTFTLSIKADVPEELQGKVLLARVSGSGKEHWLSATSARYSSDGYVTAKVGNFGVWCVAADTQPPAVKSSFASGANLSDERSIVFTIGDDLSGVASFNATIDGKWVILEHNTVKGTLTHTFDAPLTGLDKPHTIKLTLTDGAGNTTVWAGEYFR